MNRLTPRAQYALVLLFPFACEAANAQQPQRTSSAFNPAISAILQGKLHAYSQDPDEYSLPGFQMGGKAGLEPEGFNLSETELIFSANIDHLFYGQVTIGAHEDENTTEFDLEEAFVDALGLPGGLSVRFGRFYSEIGYLNKFHSHAWDFHDEPLAYRAFLGRQYRDDGLQFNWVAPTDLYLRLSAETLRGDTFPGGGAHDDFGNTQNISLQIGGDVGIGNSWQLGLSQMWTEADDRAGAGHAHGHEEEGAETAFAGDSDLTIVDFVWKWAPEGNPRDRNFIFQAEYFYREEDGEVRFTEGDESALLDYKGEQTGWYAQAVYQFIRNWRAGIRYDQLSPDNELTAIETAGIDADEAIEESGLINDGHDPERWSAMLDYSPSEFSRIRLQYNHDDSGPETNRQWTLQYIMSIGAHGAHEF